MVRRRRSAGGAAVSPPAPPEPPRAAAPAPVARLGWLQWPLLAVLVVAVYTPALRADFVNWDDQVHVYENPQVLERGGLWRSWYEIREPGPYPILITTYWAEWHAARGRPWLFHLDSALLHAGNALLVGALAGALGMTPTASLLTAAVWALHPVHVESVAWISERKNVLYAVFWLGALLLFLRAEDAAGTRRRTLFAASLVAFVLALLSKGAAMTLPAALVLARWVRGRVLDRRFWLGLAVYVALGLAGGIAVVVLVPAGVKGPSLLARIAIAGRAFWHYLAVFIWPHPLVPIYRKWPIAVGPGDLAAVAGAAIFVGVALAARNRLPRLVLFGGALFAVNIVLVLNLVWSTYNRYAFVADRYLYVPGIGLAFVAVAGAFTAARALGLSARVPIGVLAAWAAVLAVATVRQVPVWHDSGVLWTYTLAHNPECAACHLNLGNHLADLDDLDGAVAHYERALAIRADEKTLVAFGKARARQDRLDDAIVLYRRALRIVSDHADTHYALANALRRQGKTEEAIASYRRALELDPDSADMHNNLGVALLDVEQVAEARAEFERTLVLHPDDVDAELNLALISELVDHWPGAIAHYRAALARAGNDEAYAAAHHRFASALLHVGDRDQAIAELRIARGMDPDDDDVMRDLISALLAAGRPGEAVHELDAAIASAPTEPHLLTSLAWIRATNPDDDWRDAVEAVRLAERACELTEQHDADALDTLAAAYAEAGRFDEAVQTGRRALAAAEDDAELAADIRSRLALYAARRPYRVSAPDTGSVD